MHNLNDKEVYSLDIIKFKNLNIYESFYRLTFRYDGKIHCSLFRTDSDAREFIDRYYLAWQSNYRHLDTPPAEAVD
jgi:hypothetical protein